MKMVALLLIAVLLPCAAPGSGESAGPQTDLAQLPHWPVGLRLPDEMARRKPGKPSTRADVLAWFPPEPGGVRAVLLIPENTDSKHFGEHAALRAVALRHRLGILYFRGEFFTGIEGDAPVPGQAERVQQLLEWVGGATGTELRHAPWIPFGKSSRGKFPFRLAWIHPERTIASITYHGETPHWPVPENILQGAQTVLHVNVNGETEWGGTWFRHVRPALLNYRARTAWLCHQVVVPGVGHGNYPDAHGSPGWGQSFPGRVTCIQVWDYLARFIDQAITLRLPPGPLPDDHPPVLRLVEPSRGYWVDPRGIESLLGIPSRPLVRNADGSYVIDGDAKTEETPPVRVSEGAVRAGDGVPKDQQRDYFWVPDGEMADLWLALHRASP